MKPLIDNRPFWVRMRFRKPAQSRVHVYIINIKSLVPHHTVFFFFLPCWKFWLRLEKVHGFDGRQSWLFRIQPRSWSLPTSFKLHCVYCAPLFLDARGSRRSYEMWPQVEADVALPLVDEQNIQHTCLLTHSPHQVSYEGSCVTCLHNRAFSGYCLNHGPPEVTEAFHDVKRMLLGLHAPSFASSKHQLSE